MPESDRPLLRGDTKTLSAIGDYEDLLIVEPDPMVIPYVGHINISVNDVTTAPLLKINLDGKNYLADYRILTTSVTFDFGRHLRLPGRPNKKIEIYIRKTAAGSGDLIASAFVDGVEVPR